MEKIIHYLFLTGIFCSLCFLLTGCLPKKNAYSNQLYEAIKNHDEEKFNQLLEEGGDLDVPRVENGMSISFKVVDYENLYPLEIACKESPKMAKKLLDAGANPNVVDNYLHSTPLIYALETNHEERFELALLLIEKGADINHVDDNKRTAINASVEVLDTDSAKAKEDSMTLLRYLLENCDLDDVIEKSGKNPLNVAKSYNNTEAIQYITDSDYLK